MMSSSIQNYMRVRRPNIINCKMTEPMQRTSTPTKNCAAFTKVSGGRSGSVPRLKQEMFELKLLSIRWVFFDGDWCQRCAFLVPIFDIFIHRKRMHIYVATHMHAMIDICINIDLERFFVVFFPDRKRPSQQTPMQKNSDVFGRIHL